MALITAFKNIILRRVHRFTRLAQKLLGSSAGEQGKRQGQGTGRPKGQFPQPPGKKHKRRARAGPWTAVQGLDLRFISKEDVLQGYALGWRVWADLSDCCIHFLSEAHL